MKDYWGKGEMPMIDDWEDDQEQDALHEQIHALEAKRIDAVSDRELVLELCKRPGLKEDRWSGGGEYTIDEHGISIGEASGPGGFCRFEFENDKLTGWRVID